MIHLSFIYVFTPDGGSCPGSDLEAESCLASAQCPRRVTSSGGQGRRRQWGAWGAWSSCSGTCGGTRRRVRACEGVRGECWGGASEVRECGSGPCILQPSSVRDRDLVTLIIGGFRDDWLQEVSLLHPDTGAVCPGPDLPIWLADHFSVALGDKVMTCGGRSNEDHTLCWYLDVNQEHLDWVRTSK